jgi:hypothetical protein
MHSNRLFIRKTIAFLILVFPVILLLGFAMHFSSISKFFKFRVVKPPYNAEHMFYMLTSGNPHMFVVAHTIVYLAIPLMLLVVLTLGWFLYKQSPIMAFIGTGLGVIGCLAMSGVLSTWLSFSAVGRVAPEYYDGAKAALIELTKIKGTLLSVTALSYLSFIGLIILAAGLLQSRIFRMGNMLCILFGSALFLAFMDLDNWMFIGTVLILIGLIPVSRKLSRGEE